jgi:stearoyl-CoA desaturase (Delta-9 desaturase)
MNSATAIEQTAIDQTGIDQAAIPPDDSTQAVSPERYRINWITNLPFLGMHGACLGVFWVAVSWKAVALCAALYAIRMFGITGGYHRYFSHRSYRTSRAFQFCMAWIGCCALQKGPLWWAAHHRHHHRHSDEKEDVHSPLQSGFWWSHVGWIMSNKYEATDFDIVKDFSPYPELRWLDRHWAVPGVLLAAACLFFMGWPGLVWGFFISTVLLYHGTFVTNSLCHMFGKIRYKTADTSRNSFILALVTLGEGWHNNHHYYSASARMGFFWWEVDISYYTLRCLSLLGFVWDMKKPRDRVLKMSDPKLRIQTEYRR